MLDPNYGKPLEISARVVEWDLLTSSPYLAPEDSQVLTQPELEDFRLWLLLVDIGGKKVAVVSPGVSL